MVDKFPLISNWLRLFLPFAELVGLTAGEEAAKGVVDESLEALGCKKASKPGDEQPNEFLTAWVLKCAIKSR